MDIPQWAQRMDQLAADGIPFLFILDFDIAHPIIIPLDELSSGSEEQPHSNIRYEINSTPRATTKKSAQIKYTKSPVSFDSYQQGFDQVLAAIKAGDTYLLNLCYYTGLTNLPPLEEIFDMVDAPYKLFVPGKFVVFSPEQFISITDDVIRTFPMKGTIDAAVPNAEATLMTDIKEQEEHATVVDLLRNDLSMVASNVTVNRYRFITEIKTSDKTLLQCSSEISGDLDEAYRTKPGSIMHALLPAGSITGAPKKRTVELIKLIEPEPRRYFTGVFGVFDGVNLDSAVMIRMIEQRPHGYLFRSGGGITYRSIAAQEYQELIDKVYVPIS